MVGHVTPEAYEGGPIALVQNGDIITIDAQNRTLDLVSHTHTHTHDKWLHIIAKYGNHLLCDTSYQ